MNFDSRNGLTHGEYGCLTGIKRMSSGLRSLLLPIMNLCNMSFNYHKTSPTSNLLRDSTVNITPRRILTSIKLALANYLNKPLPPLPVKQPIAPVEQKCNVYLASYSTKTSDRYMIFIQTEPDRTGWIFHVCIRKHKSEWAYESERSKRPIYIYPRHCYMEYLGYVPKQYFERVDTILGALPLPGVWTDGQTTIRPANLRHEDSWDWSQRAIDALNRNAVLYRETDES